MNGVTRRLALTQRHKAVRKLSISNSGLHANISVGILFSRLCLAEITFSQINCSFKENSIVQCVNKLAGSRGQRETSRIEEEKKKFNERATGNSRSRLCERQVPSH